MQSNIISNAKADQTSQHKNCCWQLKPEAGLTFQKLFTYSRNEISYWDETHCGM